jgi:hypothetical protein
VATLLGNGEVFAVGGYGPGFQEVGSADRYNPATGAWTPAGAMANPRHGHRATVLADGHVLVSGGSYTVQQPAGWLLGVNVTIAELYDPRTGNWSQAGALNQGRNRHSATLLADGRLLVVGGNDSGHGAEIYDPASGLWTPTLPMQIADRHEHSATLLPNGKVLVVGGYHGTYPNYTYLPDAEVFDPTTGNWIAAESLTGPRAYHSATLLASGKVLVVGGEYQAGSPRHDLNTAVLYDPETGTWSADSTLNYGRLSHATVVLGSGRILVVNGASSGGVIRSAEIYDPATHRWSLADAPSTFKYSFSLTPLASGKILLSGGQYSSSQFAATETFDEHAGIPAPHGPAITTTNDPLYPGTMLTLTGWGFTGDSGASFGTWNETPTNFPLVQLQRIDDGSIHWLNPAHPWRSGYFGGLLPTTLAIGPHLATIFVNGIPSESKVVNVRAKPSHLFADVAPGHWATGYIDALFANGITTGCGGGNYCPSQNVTREQMAAFIIRAVEGEPAACATAPFPDVAVSGAFCKYIKRMLDLNVTTGCGGGNYCPTQNVTRDQMAAFIIRALEGNPVAGYCGSTPPFADVPVSNTFCGHIKRMLERNITTGCGGGNYCPTQTVTRDQMAAFLARAFLGM